MNIIYQLPFPDELCSKIVLYAFKSPHIHLPEEIFKRAMPTDIYQKLVAGGGIKKNAHGHITKVSMLNEARNALLLYNDERESLQFDIQVLQGFHNLTELNLGHTGVVGDISVLESLPKLTSVHLSSTGVAGNISVFESLPNLTSFYISRTGVVGDISVLRLLPKLTEFYFNHTGVFGDLAVIQEIPASTSYFFYNTNVT